MGAKKKEKKLGVDISLIRKEEPRNWRSWVKTEGKRVRDRVVKASRKGH